MIDKVFKYIVKNDIIILITLILAVITYSFWSYLPKGFFYVGNAICFFLLALHCFIHSKSAVVFILFAYVTNNLLDELFFDNTKFGVIEVLFGFIILMYAILTRIYKSD